MSRRARSHEGSGLGSVGCHRSGARHRVLGEPAKQVDGIHVAGDAGFVGHGNGDHDVILQVLADAGEIGGYANAERPQLVGRADPGEQQDLCGSRWPRPRG